MTYSISQVKYDPLLPDPKDLAYANKLEHSAWRYLWFSLALALLIVALGVAVQSDGRWIIPQGTGVLAIFASLLKTRRCAVLARRIRLGRAVGIGKRLFKYRERRANKYWR